MIVLSTPYAEVTLDEAKKLGRITWKGKCTSEEYKDAFMSLLNIQTKYGIIRYMSDIRNQAVISPDDRKWFETVALPKAIEQGLKAASVVFDGNVFKKYYINVILGATNKFGLPMKVFSNDLEAEKWLMTK